MARTNCRSCEKVIGQFHEDLKFDFKTERLCEFLCGDPNALYGELGTSFPPLSSSANSKSKIATRNGDF